MNAEILEDLGIQSPESPEVKVLPVSMEKVLRQDINYTTEIIGYKWRPEILWVLSAKEAHFLELLNQIPGITRRALSLQLKELEKMDFVSREVIKGIPNRVKYTITSRGQSLKPVLLAMDKWGKQRRFSLESGVPEVNPKKKTKPTPPPQPSNVLTLF
jgi:DNA-binding HxlR family transcriptional regulator